MRLAEAVLLSISLLVPFGQDKAPQEACEFGSVLEFFEKLPPIPRTCLGPLTKLATPQCRDLLGIQDTTVYIAPQSTEVKEVLTTVLKTSIAFETISLGSTTTVSTLETETRTSTRTTTKLVLHPHPTGMEKVVTVTPSPITHTLTTTMTTTLPYNHAYPQREMAQTAPLSVVSSGDGDSKSNCESLAQHILGLSHPSSMLSGACACLQLMPRTMTKIGVPSDSALSYLPGTLTRTSTLTVTQIQAVTSTVTKVHVQSVTEKDNTTKVVPALVTATVDVCRRGYKGTKQNGIGNKVVPVPFKQAPSQAECCRRCGQTANCVASAWVPVRPQQPGRRIPIKPACQLLIKERSALLSSNSSVEADKPAAPGKSQICPLGIEEYDFGEESAEGKGVVFRGPCSFPKRR